LQKEDLLKTIEECLLNFDKPAMQTAVTKALNAGATPTEIVGSIRSGFEIVSKRYEAGEFFLSELIMSGETAKVAVNVLARQFQRLAAPNSARIVLGTVEGDVHDIGKNIVSTILLSSGYNVYDLGVDVKSNDFVNKIKETDAQVLGMSALLTTTMMNMSAVITDLKKTGLRNGVKVIVGGQPVSEEFARQIGADTYVDDAPKVLRALSNFSRSDTPDR